MLTLEALELAILADDDGLMLEMDAGGPLCMFTK